MLKSISLLIVLAALGGCTTSSLTTGSVYGAGGMPSAAGVRSAVPTSSLGTAYIGPTNRAYDCYYRGSNGGRYIAQCPSGYH